MNDVFVERGTVLRKALSNGTMHVVIGAIKMVIFLITKRRITSASRAFISAAINYFFIAIDNHIHNILFSILIF